MGQEPRAGRDKPHRPECAAPRRAARAAGLTTGHLPAGEWARGRPRVQVKR